jgi:hypothetical protein
MKELAQRVYGYWNPFNPGHMMFKVRYKLFTYGPVNFPPLIVIMQGYG